MRRLKPTEVGRLLSELAAQMRRMGSYGEQILRFLEREGRTLQTTRRWDIVPDIRTLTSKSASRLRNITNMMEANQDIIDVLRARLLVTETAQGRGLSDEELTVHLTLSEAQRMVDFLDAIAARESEPEK